MPDRDAIFQRVRASLAARGRSAPLPDFDPEIMVAQSRLSSARLWDDFARNFTAVNGRTMTECKELLAFLRAQEVHKGYCDPALREPLGKDLEAAGFDIAYTYRREDYDTYQFGITRATGAIAETGTLVLTDRDTSDRLGALTPWIHVAVLDESQLLRSVGDAIAAFGETETTIIWATGPSKTADIEGILIEGVHGPGEQVCLLVKEA